MHQLKQIVLASLFCTTLIVLPLNSVIAANDWKCKWLDVRKKPGIKTSVLLPKGYPNKEIISQSKVDVNVNCIYFRNTHATKYQRVHYKVVEHTILDSSKSVSKYTNYIMKGFKPHTILGSYSLYIEPNSEKLLGCDYTIPRTYEWLEHRPNKDEDNICELVDKIGPYWSRRKRTPYLGPQYIRLHAFPELKPIE